jgi:hypothetical protein
MHNQSMLLIDVEHFAIAAGSITKARAEFGERANEIRVMIARDDDDPTTKQDIAEVHERLVLSMPFGLLFHVASA